MSRFLFLSAVLIVLACLSCTTKHPTEDAKQEESPQEVVFEYWGIPRQKVILGPESKKRFLVTIKGAPIKYGPGFLERLERSAPTGVFMTGKDVYELHVGSIVYNEKNEVRLWRSEFTLELSKNLPMAGDDKWKVFLSK